MRERQVFAYFGHHKCGSSWLAAILAEICRRMRLNYAYVHSSHMFHEQLEAFITERRLHALAYTNAKMNYVKEMPPFRGFHVVRDPRDLLVSAYFSHLHSHPTEGWPALEEHRQRLQQVSQEDGLLLEMQFSKIVFDDLASWDYAQPNVLEMKLETLAHDPYEPLIQAFSFLGMLDERYGIKAYLSCAISQKIRGIVKQIAPLAGMPGKISIHDLLAIIYRNRFSAKTGGRLQGKEDVTSHYRKGVPNDWVNHFTPAIRQQFKNEYQELLLRLGYETTTDW
ncbi:hypothetical protein U14_01797 [Candidatus Moduliflexus flocculans]|uniref:Uncharacterized protein n=1 Tax=Candidatus Moduliflexus flocculans TaxID=1499966 RepID=A0A0S6VSX2_9BACT|nr:hypothetical protein U14_01797 [Candidatus Moduliflexus flocculans]